MTVSFGEKKDCVWERTVDRSEAEDPHGGSGSATRDAPGETRPESLPGRLEPESEPVSFRTTIRDSIYMFCSFGSFTQQEHDKLCFTETSNH